MLRTAEQAIRRGNPSLYVHSGQSTSKTSGKSKKVMKGKKKISKNDSNKTSRSRSDRPKVTKDQCLQCGKPGHWKRDCPDLRGKAGPSGIFSVFPIIIDISLALNECSGWVLDTGSPAHICNSMQGMRVKRTLTIEEVQLRVGNGETLDVKAIGTFLLKLPNGCNMFE